MIRVYRTNLSEVVSAYLGSIQRDIDAVSDPNDKKAHVEKRWASKDRAHFSAVREQLRQMSGGRDRCMYCEDSYGTDIDHFAPKAPYPQTSFVWSNYNLACSFCNSNLKRSQFPLDEEGAPLLVDPSAEDPAAHLLLEPHTGLFFPRSAKGSSTIEVFGLNRAVLCQGRVDALVALLAIIEKVASGQVQGPARDRCVDMVARHSFQAVLRTMEEYAHAGSPLLTREVSAWLLNELPTVDSGAAVASEGPV